MSQIFILKAEVRFVIYWVFPFVQTLDRLPEDKDFSTEILSDVD